MRNIKTVFFILSAIAVTNILSGCAANTSKSESSASNAATAIAPGMNSQGEVVDSKLVEGEHGQKIKGLGDWEGEITGKPAPGSQFKKLQIGMSTRQVLDLIGQPSDQGAYMTGKAFIPFYFGSDRHRYEMVYKNQGRLVFAGGSVGDFISGNLIWIIHNPKESGYR
ncbi:MAG: hypothetical protein HOP02_10160 [Methylococcaceae bacterium]|nr:hypothetical protein [Methylococcaceae bacterium]